jgi:hypothetical protein
MALTSGYKEAESNAETKNTIAKYSSNQAAQLSCPSDMKTKLPVLLLACCFALLAGCASRYSIVLNNGEILTAKGRPRLDQQSNRWHYIDASGQPAELPSGRVREITPESLRDTGGSKYINSPSR